MIKNHLRSTKTGSHIARNTGKYGALAAGGVLAGSYLLGRRKRKD